MKILLLSSAVLPLLLLGCTKSFNARSVEEGSPKLRKPIVSVTMNNADSLPLCDRGTEGLQVFLAKAGTVFKCGQGNWVAVNPNQSSWGFERHASVRYNQWEDLSTRKRWAIAPARSDLASSCESGWRLPARGEVVKASANGLFNGIKANGGKAFPRAWTNEFETVNGKQERIAVKVAPGEDVKAEAGVYCVLDT